MDNGANGDKERRAEARGVGIRSELLERLRSGEQLAVDLLPQIQTPATSLSEVSFQLERLVEEGRVTGNEGGPYRLVDVSRTTSK